PAAASGTAPAELLAGAAGAAALPGALRMRCGGTEAGGGRSEYCRTPFSSIQTYWAIAAPPRSAAASAPPAMVIARFHPFGFIVFLHDSYRKDFATLWTACQSENRQNCPGGAPGATDFCIIRFCAYRKYYASPPKSTHLR